MARQRHAPVRLRLLHHASVRGLSASLNHLGEKTIPRTREMEYDDRFKTAALQIRALIDHAPAANTAAPAGGR